MSAGGRLHLSTHRSLVRVRPCRYSLLLKELLKMDPSKSAALEAVLHDLMKVAEHVNEGVRTRHVFVGWLQGRVKTW